ncbi:MAG: extracellular solute-binding protein [Defluviitaleaceae bacterium]|nr:extracellular solute-binding protein [Defluviitaleaceae bacterium]MCL2837300.1 extracellular solute-binding protein [Defluviitaleaceae bacterium]
MKKLMALLLAAVMITSLGLVLTACDSDDGPPEGVPVITMMFWGGLEEKEAVEQVAADFNKLNEGRVFVNAMHVPNIDYPAKLATMIASNEAPDIAYLSAGLFPTYAGEGHLFPVETLFVGEDEGFLDGVLDAAIWNYAGTVYGFSTAQVNLLITYNQEIFDNLGVEYPPANFEDALSWDDFVNLAQRVTVDRNGNNALHPDFNPAQIRTWGVRTHTALNNIILLAYSNGATLLNEDGTDTNFDSPEWIDTFNKFNDLIFKYHVAPSIAEAESLPAEAMLSGAQAMNFDGKWSLLAYNRQDFPLGCAVFPDLGNGPFTMSAPGVTAIFSQSEYPELAWEFFKFKMDAENGATSLYTEGLWQPIQSIWYTDPDKLAFWTDNPAHPPSFQGAVIDMALRTEQVVALPATYIRQWTEVLNIMNPLIQRVLSEQFECTGDILREAQALITSTGAFGGRFD